MNDTRAFLNHLFYGVQGHFELTLIHPTKPRHENIMTRFYRLGYDKPAWDRIMALNAQGYGVYYGTSVTAQRPRYGRRRESDVTTLSCLWCEFDLKDQVFDNIRAITDHINDFDTCPPPTAILSSGGGIHALWRIAPVAVTPDNRATIKQTLRGLAIALKADTTATDLARVLRMPSTINTKPERNGARCELLNLLPGEYTLDTFADYRRYAAPVARPIERDLPRIRPDNLPATVQAYLDAPGVQGTRNSELNKAAFILHSNGYSQSDAETILAGKAMSDGLPETEVMRTIRSAYSATPGTPGYVSRRGGLRMRAGDAVNRLRHNEK